MHIKKIAHCSFLITHTNGRIIMTDPGVFCDEKSLRDTHVDILYISHIHPDHAQEDHVKALLGKNPRLQIIAPQEVIDSVDEAVLEAGEAQTYAIRNGETITVDDIVFRGVGEHHAEIYEDISQTENVGVVIDEEIYFAGDAFNNPVIPADAQLQALLFCITGPFVKLPEALKWAMEINPVRAIPMHEGVATPETVDFILSVGQQAFMGHDTHFIPLQKDGEVSW